MPTVFGQPFYRERMPLSSGGVFDFDAVSADKTIVASISTSGARTARGKHAVGKLMKLRSDMLFLLLNEAPRKVIILCEPFVSVNAIAAGSQKILNLSMRLCPMNSRSSWLQLEI